MLSHGVRRIVRIYSCQLFVQKESETSSTKDYFENAHRKILFFPKVSQSIHFSSNNALTVETEHNPKLYDTIISYLCTFPVNHLPLIYMHTTGTCIMRLQSTLHSAGQLDIYTEN